jgi:heme oxygenase
VLEAPSSVPDRSAPIPELASEAGRVGATYVVEGSALGGVLMARTIEAALGLQGRAQSYLRYRGERTGEAWRRCVRELTAWGERASDEQRHTACVAACAVFALYQQTLDDAGALNA